MANFEVHFDGPITREHMVTVRVLAKTYEHMQRSIDRAYLISKHGNVWKHARLKANEYDETEFLALYPREGGIILEAMREGAEAVIDRIAAAVRPVFEEAVNRSFDQYDSLEEQLVERRGSGFGVNEQAQTFKELEDEPDPDWAQSYSDRSIVKEIDQMVSQVAPERVEGSTISISLQGNHTPLPFQFDGARARQFHRVAARRELGPVIIVNAIIRTLDRGNKHTKPSAKIQNVDTSREVILRLQSLEDFNDLHPLHKAGAVALYVCPIIESNGFDLKGGDLMFVAVV
jgi:hypothetical protein